MGDPHGGLGLVHVLAAGAGAAVGVDAQLVRPDVDLGLGLDLRGRIDEREGGLTAFLEIERRDPHEAMGPPLVLQVPVGVVAIDRERRALEARLFTRRALEDLGAESAPLGPAQVHPYEHLGPIGRVRAAHAGADGEERRPLVVRAAELRLETGLRHLELESPEIGRQVARDRGILIREGQHLSDLRGASAKGIPSVDASSCAIELLEHALRALAIGPQLGRGSVGL